MNLNLQIGKVYKAKSNIDYVSFSKGETYRVMREDAYPDNVFVFFKGKKRYGLRFSSDFFATYFEVLPEKERKDETTVWHNRLSKAIACLEESKLWPNVKQAYKNLLLMPYDDFLALRSISGYGQIEARKSEADALMAKYPFAFAIDSYNGKLYVVDDYCNSLADCRIKTMNFGKYETESEREEIGKAIAEGRDFDTFARTSYDVSFHFHAQLKRAYYSEEFRNCGNGHYYLALDNKHCVFCEND